MIARTWTRFGFKYDCFGRADHTRPVILEADGAAAGRRRSKDSDMHAQQEQRVTGATTWSRP